MPFCPTCKSEYVEGTRKCEDCGTTLVDERPAERESGQSRLVEVWHTQGEIDAQMIRSLLDSNGIQSTFAGESLRLTHGFTIDGLAVVKILVREEDAGRAAEIIASLDGMVQCSHCGYPVYETDSRCSSCGNPPQEVKK